MEIVGRGEELREVLARLSTRRLVTVTGPGGIGKTTLARAAAKRAAGRFDLGSYEIDLTVVGAADQVAGTIAAQLGFSTFDALLSSSTEQPVLLFVDNCEHIVEPAADAIAAFLESCRAPTVLATSRSPLEVPGESLVLLGPLPVPATDDLDTAGVQLLCERAADAGVTVTPDQRAAMARLCRELDGVPLALEVAAARLRTMTAEEILARLDDGADVLTRVAYRGAHRHRSVTETVRWSYDLLPDHVAVGFERLGVLAGPFKAETAAAVALGKDGGPEDTDLLLQALVDASLLVVERRGPTTWYRLLSIVRTFAAQRLDERGSTEATWHRFADHVVAQVTKSMAGSRGAWSESPLQDLLGMYDDIAAALRWTTTHDDDPHRPLLLAGSLWHAPQHAHVDDIAAMVAEALTRWPDPRITGAPDAAATLATARYLLADIAAAEELAEQTLPYSELAPYAPVILPRLLGLIAHARGETSAAVSWLDQAIAAARARELAALAMECEVFRASLLADLGRGEESLTELARVRAEARAAGSLVNEIWARTTEGYVRLRCAPASAPEVVADALEAARRAGDTSAVVAGVRSTAMTQVSAGALSDAARTLLRLLEEPTMIAAVGSELRMLLDVAAVLLHRFSRPSWPDVATTGRAAPVVSVLLSVGHELFPLPDQATGRALSAREAVTVVRRELEALVQGASPAPATVERRTEGVFRRSGELWEVGLAGHVVHVNGSKGVVDLATLLADPGREVHCLDLMGSVAEEAPTGDLIDATARRAYEERIRDLHADIEDAEADQDHGRADQARQELDALVDHLSASLGLAGRSRRAGGSAERARSAVSQRIRSTIKRLTDLHPRLGRHLEVSISTGTFCCYRPEHPVSWDL